MLLEEMNTQGEFNLHNVSTGISQKCAIAGSFLIGVLLPVITVLSSAAERLYRKLLAINDVQPAIRFGRGGRATRTIVD